ncbi:hypothetical protein [Flammeovirga kamogawensis]|uniref:DUF2283 domain-containing protein n=1 Tax=Flammeovirga kamogawensis TaxID=373891 RepID=A0ABX8H1D5_9BACT|nr:hypothetical protein [Flammeovirga kamogawensis]MBB6462315.1 hypothetical protein [Flammeovirga kamogawensis]QWG09434.1 hypothetical protein KM029_22770 [Flammeovirga kamogawensis]TRX64950.1 hypothetical protein EO216_20675 [Flammeovirga kamogawensis]
MEITLDSKSYTLLFDTDKELHTNRQYLASSNGKVYSRLSLYSYDVGESLPEGGTVVAIIDYSTMNKFVEEEIAKLPKRTRKKKAE